MGINRPGPASARRSEGLSTDCGKKSSAKKGRAPSKKTATKAAITPNSKKNAEAAKRDNRGGTRKGKRSRQKDRGRRN